MNSVKFAQQNDDFLSLFCLHSWLLMSLSLSLIVRALSIAFHICLISVRFVVQCLTLLLSFYNSAFVWASPLETRAFDCQWLGGIREYIRGYGWEDEGSECASVWMNWQVGCLVIQWWWVRACACLAGVVTEHHTATQHLSPDLSAAKTSLHYSSIIPSHCRPERIVFTFQFAPSFSLLMEKEFLHDLMKISVPRLCWCLAGKQSWV